MSFLYSTRDPDQSILLSPSQVNSSSKSTIPSVVVGGGLTALGTTRNLGRAGIPSLGIFDDRGLPSYSRWCSSETILRSTHDVIDFTSILKVHGITQAVLFPCSDLAVRAISKFIHSGIETQCYASIAEPDSIDTLVDKILLAEVLLELNLPHPRTVVLNSEHDLPVLSSFGSANMFLKPRNSQQFYQEFQEKAFSLSGQDDFEEKYNLAQNCGHEVFLQEYIPGSSDLHIFIDGFVNKEHAVCATFARRRLRMYPPDYGCSSCMISIPPDEVKQAIETVHALLEHCAFRGIFSAEFKYDTRDSLFKLIEVNTRPWWFVEFAASCGVNVCEMAYNDALGYPVKRINSYRVGAKFVYPYFDITAAFDLFRTGRLSLIDWLKSWWGANTPIFSWDDPLPALFQSYCWFKKYLQLKFSREQR